MRYTDIDPKDILENRFEIADLKFYLRHLGLAFAILVIMPVMFIALSVVVGRNVIQVLPVAIMPLMIFVLCAAMIYSTRSKSNQRLKSTVEKYGRDNLAMDLRDPDNEVFMLHPDKLETYVIVSSRYVYFSKMAVFALNDIKDAYIDLNDMTSQMKSHDNDVRPYDPKKKNVSETMRFCKPAYITTKDGHTERLLVGLDREQMDRLNSILRSINNIYGEWS